MTTKVSLIFALPMLALAACGGEPQQDTPDPATTAAAMPEPAASPEPTLAANTIPARFHGVWDAETGTCDPASDLRLEIGAQTIGFYESQGTVTAADASDPDVVSIQLAMEGEGDKWTQAMDLALEGEGADAVLYVRHQPDEQDMEKGMAPGGVALPLKRCPA